MNASCWPVIDCVSAASFVATSGSSLTTMYQMFLCPNWPGSPRPRRRSTIGFLSRYTVLPVSHSMRRPLTIAGFIGQDWLDICWTRALGSWGPNGTPGA